MTATTKPGVYGFKGPHRFLSNFWECVVRSRSGVVFRSTEAAYQWAKCSNETRAAAFAAMSPAEAKKAGRSLRLRPDWEFVKEKVMLALLRQKFGPDNPDLRDQLLATGDLYLEETNHWGDKYWGVCGGVGKNRLGELLMLVRKELHDQVHHCLDCGATTFGVHACPGRPGET